MSLGSRLVSSFKWNLIGQIFSISIGIVSSAVIARGLGPDDYGLYASALAIIGMILLLINLGFETIINVQLPVLMVKTEDYSIGKVNYLVRRLFNLRLIISLIVSIILYFFASQIADLLNKPDISNYLRVASFGIVFTGLISILNMIFTSQLKIMFARVMSILQQFTILIITLILLNLGLRIYGVIYATILGSIIVFIIYIFLSKKYLFHKTAKFNLSGFYKIGITSWAIGFVGFAMGKQTDIILLNYFGVASSQVGFYNIAFTFSAMLGFLGNGLGPVFQSIFSETFKKNGRKGLADSWQITAKIVFLTWFPVVAFGLLYAPLVINIIYGENYISASEPFRILVSFSLLYNLLNASFSMPVFYLINKKRLGLFFRISAGVLNLILDIILIPKYGILGAVFATGFSTALIGFFEIGVVIRNIQARLPILFYIKILMVFTLALIPTLLISGESVLYIILKGIIYGISSILLMLLIKPMESKDKDLIKSSSNLLYQLVKYF